jgi:hypothetical protein
MSRRSQRDWPSFLMREDLAPGDQVPHPDLPEDLQLHAIDSEQHPLFEQVFAMLMRQFGPAREMEARAVIAMRMQWKGRLVCGDFAMLYELQVLTCENAIVGVRDHTVIRHREGGTSYVQLSHALVPEPWRRRGLVSILRTLPVTSARELAKSMGRPDDPVLLFCEMDPLDLNDPANRIRRQSYEKAGFLGLPRDIGYLQPDFRSFEMIEGDPAGSQPVALDLLFRFVGDEARSFMTRSDLIHCIRAVYAMYSLSMSAREMAPCERWLKSFEAGAPERFPLFLPTQVP